MNNLILFLNSFLSYLLVFIIIIAVVLLAVFIGIKLRKNSDAKAALEAENQTEAISADEK